MNSQVDDKPTLMLLDGNSLAFRAFYALPAENFKTKNGLTTNAVYGFTAMLILRSADTLKLFDTVFTMTRGGPGSASSNRMVAALLSSRVGIAPIKVSYLKAAESTEFSEEPTDFMTVVPVVYNADTLGIRPDLIKRPIESWKELLNPEFKGKAAILNIPSIGIMDARDTRASRKQVPFRFSGISSQSWRRTDAVKRIPNQTAAPM